MRRRAFTLIELLVVLAIVGVLVALTAAAVMKARAAAYRTACLGNLRQIGLGLHHYHDVERALPPGGTVLDAQHWLFLTWQTRLLPFVEQSALWGQAEAAYRTSQQFWLPPHVLHVPVALYGCPADPRTLRPFTSANGMTFSVTAYLGVEGADQIGRDGLLYAGSRHRFADVTDGLSATLLVGERPPRADHEFGWWYNGHGLELNGSAGSVLGVRARNVGALRNPHCDAGPYRFGPGRFDDDCAIYHFWSAHAGGGHFLFGDGGARFLAYSVEPLLPALASRAGGEVAALSD